MRVLLVAPVLALHLRTDGSTESADVLNEAPNFFTGTIAFGGTAASVVQQSGRGVGNLVTAPADALPVIATSMGLIDHLLSARQPKVGETVQLKVLNIRNRVAGTLVLKRFAEDSVLVDCDGCMRRGVTEEPRVGLTHGGAMAGATRVEQHWTVTVP